MWLILLRARNPHRSLCHVAPPLHVITPWQQNHFIDWWNTQLLCLSSIFCCLSSFNFSLMTLRGIKQSSSQPPCLRHIWTWCAVCTDGHFKSLNGHHFDFPALGVQRSNKQIMGHRLICEGSPHFPVDSELVLRLHWSFLKLVRFCCRRMMMLTLLRRRPLKAPVLHPSLETLRLVCSH